MKQYSVAAQEMQNAIFFTTQGGLMGLGALSMIPGDSIWLFPSAEVPYILRENSDRGRFMLVGDAYVHGIMRGEAFEYATEWSTIEIQ